MYIPDHVMVRKIHQYDPLLSVKWNSGRKYWEIWRKTQTGPQLITTVTESIYKTGGKMTFVPLDERILWWLSESDTWKHGSVKKWFNAYSRAAKEFENMRDAQRRRNYYDSAKDLYGAMTKFYFNRPALKNSKYPSPDKKQDLGIRPVVQSKTAPKVWYGR